MEMRILIVEDDEQLRVGLAELLTNHDYQVEVAGDFSGARKAYRRALREERPFHLFLLDVMLQEESGFSLCEEIRTLTDAPVIFLTAKDDEESITRGLDIGGDDYIAKPFHTRELLSRISANLRRYCQKAGSINPVDSQVVESGEREAGRCLKCGDLIFVCGEERVYIGGQELKLRRMELILLKYFMENHGILLRREQILGRLWDDAGEFVEDNTLSVNISRLRRRLGKWEGADYIETVRGLGYRWTYPVRRDRIPVPYKENEI